MKNFLTRKRGILFSLIIALCLCSALFVASLGVKADADDVPTYEFVGIKPEDNQTASDNFYALTTTQAENYNCSEGSWEIWYSGSAKRYDASENTTTDTTVSFRIVQNVQSRELFFTGLVAEEGDVYTVGGIYNIDHFESSYAGSVQVGDYVLKLANTSFKWTNGAWKLEKEKIDEAPSGNIFLDMNGSDASIFGKYVRFNTGIQGWFPSDNAANVNVCYPANAVEENEAVTVDIGKKYKAANYSKIRVKVLVAIGGEVDTTTAAYKTADSTEVAGSVLSKSQETILLEVDPSKVADADGYIDSFVIKRTGSAGQLFFDYVELVPNVEKVDERPKDNIVLGVNGTDVTMVPVKQYAKDVNKFFDATGEKVIAETDNIGNNTVMNFAFTKIYKASNFDSVKIEYIVSDWTSVDNKITITAYALSDVDCVNPLASHTVNGSNNTKDSLTISAADLASDDGYIKGLKLKKTQTGTADTPDPKWQFFVNEVTMTPAKENVDGKPTDSIFLDANGEDMWLIGNYINITDDTANGNWWGFFTPSDKNVKVSFPANAVEEGEAVKVVLSKRYKASNLFKITVKILVGGAVNVTTSAYATADSAEVAGAVLTTKDTEVVLLEIDPLKVADENGYVDSFVIKRAGGAGQLFFDYVELIPADPLSEDKYVATGYFGGVAAENANWTKKLESVNGWNDKTEGVNMSYPINIEADKDAKNGYAFKMYFHSWYGTMSSNAIIFKKPVTKEEAKAGLVIRIKAHLSPNGATYNTELGGIRLHGLDSTGKEGEGYMIPATITQDKFVLLALSGDEAEKLVSSDGKIYGIQIGSAEQVNDANANSFYQAYNGDGPNGSVAYIEIDYIELRKEVTITYYNATENGETETGKALTGLGSETLYKNPKDGATKKFFGWVKGSDASAISFDNLYDFSSDLDGDVNLYGWWIDSATELSDHYGVYKTADGKEVVIYSQGIELKGYADYENTILDSDGKLYVKRKVGSEILNLSDSSVFTKSKVVEITFYAFGEKIALKALGVNDVIDYTFAPDGYTFDKWTNENGEEITTANETVVALYAVCARVEISADEYAEYLGKYVNRSNGDLLELKADHVATLTLADGTTKNITYYLLENGGFAYINGETEIPCTFNANRVLVSADTEYARLTSYTVTFYVDGSVYLTVMVNSGDYRVSAPETTPAKDGFEFVGWYTAMGGEEKYDFGSLVYKNISLYASFKKVEKPDDSGKDSGDSGIDSGNDGGCFGSVSGMSGLCALAFVGVAFAISKKKQKKD